MSILSARFGHYLVGSLSGPSSSPVEDCVLWRTFVCFVRPDFLCVFLFPFPLVFLFLVFYFAILLEKLLRHSFSSFSYFY